MTLRPAPETERTYPLGSRTWYVEDLERVQAELHEFGDVDVYAGNKRGQCVADLADATRRELQRVNMTTMASAPVLAGAHYSLALNRHHSQVTVRRSTGLRPDDMAAAQAVADRFRRFEPITFLTINPAPDLTVAAALGCLIWIVAIMRPVFDTSVLLLVVVSVMLPLTYGYRFRHGCARVVPVSRQDYVATRRSWQQLLVAGGIGAAATLLAVWLS